MTKVIYKGAIGASQLREFWCPKCQAYFEAFTKRASAESGFEARTHSCGNLCETAKVPSRAPAVRGQEWNSVPRDHRAAFQKYWGLTDNQMGQVTREQMDSVMKRKGLSFVDRSWDENVNGGRRERGDVVALPPDTEDPQAVEQWNEKNLGREFVQQQQEQIREVFDAASRGDITPLPHAEDVAVRDTPHTIDVERTVRELAAAPVVEPERRRELQGKVVTGR